MSVYLVGKDDSGFFKKRTTWELLDAIEDAQSGDVIELEEGYYYESEKTIILSKAISIVGNTYQADSTTYFPTLACGVCVKGGAKVKLENVIVSQWQEKRNVLNVKERSTLIADNVIIENTMSEGELYPKVYISDNSIVEFYDCLVRENEVNNDRMYIQSSRFIAKKSKFYSRITSDNSNVIIDDCYVSNSRSNAILTKNNSTVRITQSTIEGGDKEGKYPCLFLSDSELDMSLSIISQPYYNAALYSKTSKLLIDKSRIDSFQSFSSITQLTGESEIIDSIDLEDASRLSGDSLIVVGRNNGKINLYAREESIIEFDSLYFGQLSSPNIRLERNVKFEVKSCESIEYYSDDFLPYRDDDGNLEVLEELSDIDYFGEKTAHELLEEMIGLDSVKRGVKEFIAINKLNKRREQQGFSTTSATMHALFLGNPGTGKTTVARLIGRLLKEEGLIEKGQFVETSRSDLVGEYIGETAQKTREVLESALGGVLFIDEAYTLASRDNPRDFGAEAINEILKFMEDHRREIVIIFAGYTNSMEEFLDMNEGLRSRIPNSFIFEDYTIPQLVIIGLSELESQGYKIDEERYADLVEYKHGLTNDNSNGRWIRNLNESLLRALAISLLDYPDKDLNQIDNDVIDTVKNS